ncbi:MAG: hypothetical protein KJ887_06750 [Candidatus Omnitrophica bacterium]|nr:hypothetical protein [Candidatus Omnitrophota bacterium]MBU1048222.1 hypothetical protein [Candidatus Omnitrophota bacterium]MBU1631138.1 hypothetical protein [Candidatus Omnitrophota bacterium]MBU1767126.1 hypothetical protein [Candidatus Omnitrophota bacterium]MBU1889738.1 hypothetical protein [Candidatus Omnitrophota bacterium]
MKTQFGLKEDEIKTFISLREGINSILKLVVDQWKLIDPNAQKIDPNEISQKYIEIRLGGLKDMSAELADFIQQSALQYFGLLADANKPGWLPKQMIRICPDLEKDIRLFIKQIAKLESFMRTFPVLIQAIRQSKPSEKQYLINYTLDELKYGIKNADKKPAFWRKIERQFKITK